MQEIKLQHYEIVFLINPDKSANVQDIIQRYESLVKEGGGVMHRLENWGNRPLAYPIKNLSRAIYILMNIECGKKTLDEVFNSFRYSNEIIRNLILRRDFAITEPSNMIEKQERMEETSGVVTAESSTEINE